MATKRSSYKLAKTFTKKKSTIPTVSKMTPKKAGEPGRETLGVTVSGVSNSRGFNSPMARPVVTNKKQEKDIAKRKSKIARMTDKIAKKNYKKAKG